MQNEKDRKNKKEEFPGYPPYPSKEDIYNEDRELKNVDPQDVSSEKSDNASPDAQNDDDFPEEKMGDDLDVPGEELDDSNEDVGEEDEENNYYSLGGDNHD
jgi:hypothetical protein